MYICEAIHICEAIKHVIGLEFGDRVREKRREGGSNWDKDVPHNALLINTTKYNK